MEDVEKIYSNYLETHEADIMFNEFFQAVRNAFMAGYKAASGKLPLPQPVIELTKTPNQQKHR